MMEAHGSAVWRWLARAVGILLWPRRRKMATAAAIRQRTRRRGPATMALYPTDGGTRMKNETGYQELAPSKAYRLLESGPVLLVATGDVRRPNVMTMGFHMMVQHEPPLVAGVIGPWDHSYDTLQARGECVLAIPTVDLAEQVTKIGNCSGVDMDKFARFGLTAQRGKTVAAPLVRECIANLECRVVDDTMVERYNLFILEVTRIRVDSARHERRLIHHAGDGRFIADGESVDMSRHMTRWRYLMDR
jgi:flavin reductase (DIM6/NTAB) family NADH-FMN oxidoreductase RutF